MQMLNKPTYGEVEKQLTINLEVITKTIQENAAALSTMYDSLKVMFNKTHYGESKIYYLLRAAVYQKAGYAGIISNTRRALYVEFSEKNPKAAEDMSYEIQRATGLKLSDAVIANAIERDIKGSMDHWMTRDQIRRHTDKELDKLLGN